MADKNRFEIINEKEFMKARKKIREIKNRNTGVIFSGESDSLNRQVLEKEKIDVFLLNQTKRKDWMKQRNSGLNHVLARLAKKSGASVGINLDEIVKSNKKEKSEILGRVEQNVKLCSKSKVQMQFVSLNDKNKRNVYDLKSLGIVLGMPTWMTKNICNL